MQVEEVKFIHEQEKRSLTLQEAKMDIEENLGRDWNTGILK